MRASKLGIIALLLLLNIMSPFSTTAQDGAENVVSVRSGRYSLELPQGWTATTTPILTSFQGIFNYDSISFASSKSVLDSLADLAEEDLVDIYRALGELDGAMIVGLVFPAPLLTALAGTENVTQTLLEANVEVYDPNYTITPLDIEHITGERYDFRVGSNQATLVVGFDVNENMLLIAGISDGEHWERFSQIIDSTSYRTFGETELLDSDNFSQTVDLIPNVIQSSIAPGWWVFETPDGILFTPDEGGVAQIARFGSGTGLGDFDSVLIVVGEIDANEGLQEALSTDNEVDMEALVDTLDLDSIYGFGNGRGVLIDGGTWVNDHGIEGIFFQIAYQIQNVDVYFVAVQFGEEIYGIGAVTSYGNMEANLDLINSILATARPIDE